MPQVVEMQVLNPQDIARAGKSRPDTSRTVGEDVCATSGLNMIYTINIYFRRVAMKTAKLFKNGESQAVRLPKEFRFRGKEVFIKRIGSAVVLLPKANSWATLIESLAKFPSDFMETRGQPSDIDRREPLQ